MSCRNIGGIMAVEDDIRRLSQIRGIYLGMNLMASFTAWFEGSLQLANDGNWIFRSKSSDGTIVAFQVGHPGSPATTWSSGENADGIWVNCQLGGVGNVPIIGGVLLRQQLPQGVTN